MSTRNKRKTKSTKPARAFDDEFGETARKMDENNRRRLPDGVIKDGVLRGMEPDIRQEALIMAIGGFLQRNDDYAAARRRNDVIAIEQAIERCSALTLRYCKERVASRVTKLLSRQMPLDESIVPAGPHPSQLHPFEWPVDRKADVIMEAVGKAVRCGKLSRSNAAITSMVCESGMKVHEVAQAWKISVSAAYQQIRRVRSVIPEIMEHIDSCLS